MVQPQCPKCGRLFRPVDVECGRSVERTCRDCGVVVKVTVQRAPAGHLIALTDFRAA